MPDDVLLSKEGYEKLRRELEQLKREERPRIAEAIREAKSHGDLRENAMYSEARLNQKRLEARISELEHALQVAKVVERPDGKNVAHLGSKVTVKNLKREDEIVLTLVGAYEADPGRDLISIASPLGAALVERHVDDEVEVVTPSGVQQYRVLKVE